MKGSNVDKYLSLYAEPEVHHLDALLPSLNGDYQYCLVIPAFDEDPHFIDRLSQLPNINKVLTIIIINQPENSPIKESNTRLFNYLVNDNTRLSSNKNLFAIRTENFDAVVIDRFNSAQQIPPKQGVGLARKIGADIACKVISKKALTSNWIYSTDADAHLPHNYFSLNHNKKIKDCTSCIFEFTHTKNDSTVSHATQLYEQALKYYRCGLSWAKSPYAFHTLGSTLAFTLEAYCKVRGFPKKSAGEDFYLLNKLAKVGGIYFDPDIVISLESRISERIPFGTGPAVKRIIEESHANINFSYYNPKIFALLKQWLYWVTHDFAVNWCQKDANDETWLSQAQNSLCPEIIEAIDSIQFNSFIVHASAQCKTSKMFISHFHKWFDAFKTMKFIHFLQSQHLPAQTLNTCLIAQDKWI